jgi:hypothetical protein
MKSMKAKVGAVLVAALALWSYSACADPGNGKSDQWLYEEWDLEWAHGGTPWVENVPCLGEDVLMSGFFRLLVNVHTTPAGIKTYTRHFVQQDGDIVVTGLSSGKQYFIKAGMCFNENAHGDWEVGGSYGTDTAHMVFVAEDGGRVVLKVVLPSWPEMKHLIWSWNCK